MVTCPLCRRYTSTFVDEKSLQDHMKEIHPIEAARRPRGAYGINVGK